MWRKIQCPLAHYPLDNDKGICINGVLYYLAKPRGENNQYSQVLVCFDVRSEKFSFIDSESYIYVNPYGDGDTKWINYKGKLGLIECVINCDCAELRLWVLADVEKQEWSKYVYTLPPDDIKNVDRHNVSVVGMTATGIGEYHHRVYAFVDVVEDLHVNDAKYLKSSQGLNNIWETPNPIIRKMPKLPKPQNLGNSAPLLKNKYDLLADLE
ncbi:unnamed protein product [Microthlaspi erraticum]|uniref:F-box associated beta-propeller type 3 domain-containing protein n=1 Tax=Microthlaspi erraticum TaxID=1685480 RepID=A0A6D2L8Q4_9BRAS|nr:unnamed protein product [Microthlaspi erraticum]